MQIHDLGRLEIESAPGRPAAVVVGTKQIALLSALCAMRGTRVSFELLREAAWGERAAVADATIENHVWRLRRRMEPGVSAARSCLRHEEGGYRLDLPPEAVDSALFEALSDAAREARLRTDHHRVQDLCERALALWRGDPFLSIVHAPRFEMVVARLVEIRAQLEERRVDALLALGDTEQAALDGARLTTLYPFRENLWAQRMIALVRLGRVEEALSVFQRVRSVLREELGLDPGHRLQDLQLSIVTQGETDPHPPLSDPTPAFARPPEQPWPLLGRRAETALMTTAVRGGRTLVVQGAGGVGRTRMLEEAIRIAQEADIAVLRFVGTRSAADVPLGVIADLVSPDARSADRLGMLQVCAATLRERASGRPLLVCVDDAHLLDDSSAALILHLASTGDIRVGLTVKSGEPLPDAVRALVHDTKAQQVRLEPLDEPDTAQLLEDVLGAPADELLHRWAYRTTGGNAFHTVSLARAVHDDPAVRLWEGRWIAERVPSVPPSLGALVQDELERLDAPSRDLVDRLALAEPMRLAALDEDGRDAALLVALEKQGLVIVEDHGRELRVALAHPLVSAALRETLPPLRARQVRRDLIARFAARPGLAPDERLRLATWRMETGQPGGIAQTVGAAELALSFNDPGLALRLLGQLTDGADGAGAVDVDVRLLQAQAHMMRSEHDEAAVALQGVEPALHTPEQGAVYLEAQIEIGRFGHSRLDDLPDLFARAVRWWPGDADWARLVERLRLRDEIFETQTGADGIERVATASESARLGSLYYSGRTAEARAMSVRVVRDPPLLTLDEVASAAIAARVELDRGDDLDGFEHRFTRMRALGYDADDPAAIGIATSKLADLRLLQGHADQALELYEEAARHWERRDRIGLRASAWVGIAIAAAQQGDATSSRAALHRAHDIAGDIPRAHLVPNLARADAVCAVVDGDPAAATAHLDSAILRLLASPMHVARLHYERVLLGLGVDADVVRALRTAAAAADSPLMNLYAMHGESLLGGDADGLREVSRRLRALGVVAYAESALVDAARLD